MVRIGNNNNLFCRRLLALSILAAGFVLSAHAQIYHVRSGAAGAGDGSDWNNAFTSLPATLVRGATYYIADGNYGRYVFDDPLSGTQVITIKKATVEEHGTNVGWQNTYGDGEAVFSTTSGNVWVFGVRGQPTSGYYVIDGKVGAGKTPGRYGFRLDVGTQSRVSTSLAFIPYGLASFNNLTIRHVEFDFDNGSPSSTAGTTGAFTCYSPASNFIFQSNYVHHSTGLGVVLREGDNPWNRLNISNVLIDGNYFYMTGGGGGPSAHWEIFWLTGINGLEFRHNTIEDVLGPLDAQTGWIMIGACRNVRFHGNLLFCNPETPNTLVGNDGLLASWVNLPYENTDFYIYNNTFVNLPRGARVSLPGSANVVSKNNVYYNAQWSWTGVSVQSHEAVGGGQSGGGNNLQTGLSPSSFVNFAGKDFRLSRATAPGDSSIGVAFGSDLSGIRRGIDGVWDRGAFEFVAGPPDTAAPTILGLLVSAITPRSATISWTTDESATSVVEYGTDSNYGSVASAVGLSTVHFVVITNLAPDTVYQFRARSVDTAGNVGLSANANFRSGFLESVRPVVLLTSPANGITVSNSVLLTANATDNVAVTSVKFFVSGVQVFEDGSAPYSFDWDSASLLNGAHTVYAQASDAAGNVGWSATNSIIVNNPAGTLPRPAAYWSFDEGSGNTANDSVSGNVMTLVNGAGWSNGVSGGALALNGVFGRTEAQNSPTIDLTGNAMSICAWVRLESKGDWQQIVAKVNETGTFSFPYFSWHLFAGHASPNHWTPQFQVANAGGASVNVSSSTNVSFGEWVHVVGTYDGSSVRIYVNGIERGSAPQSGNLVGYNQPLYIGAHGLPGEHAKGLIDEVRLYSRALSPVQIQGLYRLIPSGNRPSPPSNLRVVQY